MVSHGVVQERRPSERSERLFLRLGHEPYEKPEGQFVLRWGGCTRVLAVLDGVEEARAREAECGSVPPGADIHQQNHQCIIGTG
jgi:hypothetical protein